MNKSDKCEGCEKMKQFLLVKIFYAFSEENARREELQINILEELKDSLTDEDLIQVIKSTKATEVREKAAILLSSEQREFAIETLESCCDDYNLCSYHGSYSRCVVLLEKLKH
ncbi:hypothetical protein ACFL08_01145 [Patescibacteria group bacterium]